MPNRRVSGGLLESLTGHLLHRASQAADQLFSLEVDALAPREFAVLVCVAETDGLSQKEILEQTGIGGSTLSVLLQRMAKKGLVHRRRSKRDARLYEIRLTAAGRTAVASTAPKAARADASVLEALSDEQRDALVKALKVILS
jgi:MarR family transcriptional regulator, temperature-dependent positive regulator of motility